VVAIGTPVVVVVAVPLVVVSFVAVPVMALDVLEVFESVPALSVPTLSEPEPFVPEPCVPEPCVAEPCVPDPPLAEPELSPVVSRGSNPDEAKGSNEVAPAVWPPPQAPIARSEARGAKAAGRHEVKRMRRLISLDEGVRCGWAISP